MDLTKAFSKVTDTAQQAAIRKYGSAAASVLEQAATAVSDVAGVSGSDKRAISDFADTGVDALRRRSSMTAVVRGAPAAPQATAPPKPVFQLSALPLTINPANYKNPVTDTNPQGTYTSLFAFRALVDPVPSFARYYTPVAGASTEMLWGDLVNGASVSGDAGFARSVLAGAQQRFTMQVLTNMGGVPGEWRPVYATPDDWFDFSIPDRFLDFEIDLANPDTSDDAYATIDSKSGGPPLKWLIGKPGATQTVNLDPKTKLKAVRFKALLVSLSRPWLDFSLFKMNGIYLQGQSSGLYSSGQLASNDGILPLLTGSFCLAKDIQIEADWAPNDLQVVTRAEQNSTQITLGQFALSSGQALATGATYATTLDHGVASSSAVQLIGWISTLVPLWPRMPG